MYQSNGPCHEENSTHATYRSCSAVSACDSMGIKGFGRVILEFMSEPVHVEQILFEEMLRNQLLLHFYWLFQLNANFINKIRFLIKYLDR